MFLTISIATVASTVVCSAPASVSRHKVEEYVLLDVCFSSFVAEDALRVVFPCRPSWPMRFAALVVFLGCGMCLAGFSGIVLSSRCVPFGCRPAIMAGTDQKDSCSGMCKAGFSGVSAPHAVLPEVYRKIGLCGIWRVFFYGPLYLEVTCSSCLPEVYMLLLFREMTPGMVSVVSTPLCSTVDTCSASVYEAF